MVLQPDGVERRYGFDPNARIHLDENQPSGQPVARWLLREVEDTHGNVVRFTYHRWDPSPPPGEPSWDPGTAYLAEVAYTYRGGQPVGELRRIRVVYEDRPDAMHHFAGGLEQWVRKWAREIQITVEDDQSAEQVLRRRLLLYDRTGYATGRSRLTSTQLFGTDCPLSEADPRAPVDPAHCQGMPAQTFQYADASDLLDPPGPAIQWVDPGWTPRSTSIGV